LSRKKSPVAVFAKGEDWRAVYQSRADVSHQPCPCSNGATMLQSITLEGDPRHRQMHQLLLNSDTSLSRRIPIFSGSQGPDLTSSPPPRVGPRNLVSVYAAEEETFMRYTLLVALTLVALFSFAQQADQPQPAAQPAVTSSTQPQPGAQTAPTSSNGCLAVAPIGSHAFRNIMLAGVAGALISKQQYEVVDVVNYPGRIGQKFHGNDLQTIQSSGTKVVILDKHYTPADLQKACH
jgi:hypothetical protein